MKYLKHFLITNLLFFSATLSYAAQFPQDISLPHQINYSLPNAETWQLENKINDAGGYTEVYKTENDGFTQRITLNYGRNINTPLTATMQEVLQTQATTNCQIQQSKIIKQNKNSLIFTTYFANCPSNKSLMEIYKVFNMSDGQYSINYATNNPSPQDSTFVKKLKNIIESASIN